MLVSYEVKPLLRFSYWNAYNKSAASRFFTFLGVNTRSIKIKDAIQKGVMNARQTILPKPNPVRNT